MEKLRSRKTGVANWYLDLTLLEKYWGDERTYHHTAPISLNFALREGLRIALEEGLDERYRRHRENAQYLWEGLESLGLEMHVDRDYRLATLTTVKVPVGIEELSVRKKLLTEYNIEIAGGLGELKGKIWRIGLMGYSSKKENVASLLGAFKDIL
jgi:alanine-glyoxylate transaminase/serine-glyoxylate transaminase/serine-pyruvate transaminase